MPASSCCIRFRSNPSLTLILALTVSYVTCLNSPQVGNLMESIYSKKNKDIIEPGNIQVDLSYGSHLCAVSSSGSGAGPGALGSLLNKWLLWDLSSQPLESLRLGVDFQAAAPSALEAAVAMQGWSNLRDLVASQIIEVFFWIYENAFMRLRNDIFSPDTLWRGV